jgi:uncharacterized protein (DUF2336 family)
MMGLFDFLKPSGRPRFLEDEEKKIAREGSEKQRLSLASDERTSQEILYYLAQNDPSPRVRKKVAGNPSTPLQASEVLSKDNDMDIRLAIAKRLVRILPKLHEDAYSQLYAYAVQSLGMLALDEVLKVRKALSETLKDYAKTPPDIAVRLAKDLEREVSEPILRFCMAIPDKDLMDILKTHPANWAAEAIAGRRSISAQVSEAVIETGNVRAGSILLSNDGAHITPNLLQVIVDRAREHPEWHKPIAARSDLPPLMARKLAAYVDKSVKKILLSRSDLDAQTISDISTIIQRRLDFEAEKKKSNDPSNSLERAEKLYRAGSVTEEIMADAVIMGDKDFVFACLALMAGTKISNIQKVFDVRAPKSICAICWRCGFSMRLALKLQQHFGRVPYASLIYPRGGSDYPMAEADLKWQLDVIGIP